MQIMPRLLARLRKNAPDVKVRVYPWSGRSLGDMATGKLDLSINILPLNRADLHKEIIAPVEGVVLMSKTHPYASLEQLTRSQFLAYPHVGLSIAEYAEKPFASQIAMLLENREVMLSTSDPHLAFEVVNQTDAMMIGTRSLCSLLMERYKLTTVKLPADLSPLRSDYQMTWHRLMHRDSAHIWMRNVLMEECQHLLDQELKLQVA